MYVLYINSVYKWVAITEVLLSCPDAADQNVLYGIESMTMILIQMVQRFRTAVPSEIEYSQGS